MAMNKTDTRRANSVILSMLAVAIVLALFFAYRRGGGGLHLHAPRLYVSARQLPYYAFCSFSRMTAAYILALAFSLVYGLLAARGAMWERVLIPAIDIAQSVPVVGFFPAAIFFFVALAHGSRFGVEMAAVFLIFTSQAWNMALGVYESVRTLPNDSLEALDAFGATGWLRLKRLLLPACVPKLVYNSILSWVAGWYYLIACEIIAVGPAHYELPGLGSYLMTAAEKGRTGEQVAGLLTLLAIIILMDVIVWQPLSIWAEKFRYEFAASSAPPPVAIGMLGALGAVGPVILRTVRAAFRPILRAIHSALATTRPFNAAEHPALRRGWRIVRVGLMALLFFFAAYGAIKGTGALIRTLLQPWPAAVRQIPLATGASMLRMIAAYLITLAWTIPCAIAASESQIFARRMAPIAEILGSMPATALFPAIVMFMIRLTGGMNLASILLILTGMQWYVLFNLLAGVSQIPEDLKEAARSFGLSRMATWRTLTLPALLPSLLTGSITAWGGGWNALILSEYFVYRATTYKVFGLGAMLDDATYQTGNGLMILLTLLSMVLVVIVLNRLMWRRLYNIATDRYRIDY
ncbi:MAG TPA: ABC transporter permease subunit [Candidatus Binataceae bacterium]|nr:ABC transporter permease subunit [Candidatus Binataceae bacterium]